MPSQKRVALPRVKRSDYAIQELSDEDFIGEAVFGS